MSERVPVLVALKFVVAFACLAVLSAWVGADDASTVSPARVPVTAADLGDLVFFPARTAPATVVSLNDARVSAEISGVLEQILVRVGDQVGEDAVVARIDCRDAEEGLSEAEAALAASRAANTFQQSQHAKAKKLSERKSISDEEIDRRRSNALVSAAELNKSEAALNQARLAVERCDVKAPFNAVVVERLASVGDFVTRGTPVIRLLDTDSTEVSARVQEQDLESVKVAAQVFFDSQNVSYPVVLRTIVPVMESRLRSYETRFTFDAAAAAPGSAGRLRWFSPQPHVPAELIVQRQGLGVFTVAQGRAHFVAIPGAQEGKPAAWPGAVQGQVIVDGRFSVNDGDPVQVGER